jgi:hypothetical protein
MIKDFIRRIRVDGIENVFKRYYSFYPAYVVNNNDPENKYRLRLHIPTIHHANVHEWVVGGFVNAGKNYGNHSLPNSGSMVYVFFLQGDTRYPRWVYGWYGNDELPKEFNSPLIHGFKTPGGITVKYDDQEDTISITNKQGSSFKVNKDVIELLGDSNFLVKYNELEKAFNELNDKFNSFANSYVAGGPTTQGLPVKVLPSDADITKAKNEKIKTN